MKKKEEHTVYLKSEANFWGKVHIPDDFSACWYWLGGRNSFGHGFFESVMAHRYSWAIRNHMVAHPCLVVCHDCDNPPCVNPGHLILGTHQDNSRDVLNRDRRTTRALDERLHGVCTECGQKTFYPVPVGKRVIGTNCCFYRLRANGEIKSAEPPVATWNRTAPPRRIDYLGIRATKDAMNFLARHQQDIPILCNPRPV